MKSPKHRTPVARESQRVRYAVVGLGWIAQTAFLPAFAGARENSELAALVSDDAEKLKALGRKYKVEALYSYDEFDRCLGQGGVDAVVIALPNTMHRAYTEAAANAGVHVLCEKPMAMTEQDCESMIESCRAAGVKLMVGYRLHFEKANLEAVALVRAGTLGEPRLFHASLTQSVEAGNFRLRGGEGGPLYDVGIYCVNAARYLFRAEPVEVFGWHARREDQRFRESPEATSALLRFPDDRLATFICSFGAAGTSSYEIVGTKASLRVDPAFGIAEDLAHHLTRDGKTRTRTFAAREQFGPELVYFSRCILKRREPEPSGEEGLADVRILRAVERSAEEGRAIKLGPFLRERRPIPEQEIRRPLREKPKLVKVQDPSPSS
jgi:glucose-fructose oxidoreductase